MASVIASKHRSGEDTTNSQPIPAGAPNGGGGGSSNANPATSAFVRAQGLRSGGGGQHPIAESTVVATFDGSHSRHRNELSFSKSVGDVGVTSSQQRSGGGLGGRGGPMSPDDAGEAEAHPQAVVVLHASTQYAASSGAGAEEGAA